MASPLSKSATLRTVQRLRGDLLLATKRTTTITTAAAAANVTHNDDDENVLDILNQLSQIERMTIEILRQTQIGRAVKPFKRSPHMAIRARSKYLHEKWREMVAMEAAKEEAADKTRSSTSTNKKEEQQKGGDSDCVGSIKQEDGQHSSGTTKMTTKTVAETTDDERKKTKTDRLQTTKTNSTTNTTYCVNVKVAHIRPEYNNLSEWVADSQRNVYIGRRGVVFVDGKRFPPEDSPWCNPFRISKQRPHSTNTNTNSSKIRNNKISGNHGDNSKKGTSSSSAGGGIITRDQAVQQYETYLRQRLREEPHLATKLVSDLKGKRLGCWCKPAACHGEVLIRLMDELEK